MADTVTTNFKFVKPSFNKKPWQQDFYNTLDAIDAVLSRYILVQNFQGVWQNATAYTVGQRTCDPVGGGIYTCLVAHTSNPINTFAQDRTVNSSFWSLFSFSVQFRGAWATGTQYSNGDFVTFGQKLAVCLANNTASASFVTDQANGFWNVIIDGTALAALPTGTIANADQVIRYDGASLQYQLAPNTVKLSSGGVLTLPAGAVGAPTLNFNAVGGFYSPGASLIALTIGGTEVFRMKNDGTLTLLSPDLFRQGVGFPAAAVANAGQTLGWDAAGTSVVNVGPLSGLTNRIINGDMRIAQYGTSQAAPVQGCNTADRFRLSAVVTTAALTQSQSADHPLLGANGFSLAHTVVTSDTVGATKVFNLSQRIEGYNVADIIGQGKATLAFYVKSPKTGIHCVSFGNNVGDRNYIVEYTVNVANTWERKVITVDFTTANASGGWNYTSGIGLQISWPLMMGSSFQGAANTWQAGNLFATANQQNLLDTNGNVFKITDVIFVPGSNAPVFERRPYTIEFSLCQRYHFVLGGTASVRMGTTGAVNQTNQMQINVQHPVETRTACAVAVVGTVGNILGSDIASSVALTSVAFGIGNTRNTTLNCTQAGTTWTVGRAGQMWASDATTIQLDAEL